MTWFSQVNRWTLSLAALGTIFMVILTAEQVVARYFFKASSVGIQELQWHLFGFVFLLSASATLEQNQHVRVDIFYGRSSPRTKAWVDLIGTLIFLLPSMAVLVWFGFNDVLAARDFSTGYNSTSNEGLLHFLLAGEGSPDPGGLPARWIVKSFLPLGALLVFVQGLVGTVYNLKTLFVAKD